MGARFPSGHSFSCRPRCIRRQPSRSRPAFSAFFHSKNFHPGLTERGKNVEPGSFLPRLFPSSTVVGTKLEPVANPLHQHKETRR